MDSSAPEQVDEPPLGDWLLGHSAEILPRWLGAIRDCAPSGRLSEPALVDHLPRTLDQIAEAVDRIAAGDWSSVRSDAAVAHALRRRGEGFELGDSLTELFLLRDVLLDLLLGADQRRDPSTDARLLCWAIDAALRESVLAFKAADQRALNALDRVSAVALGGDSLDGILPRLLDVLIEAVPDAKVACILLARADKLVHRAAVGPHAAEHVSVEVALGEGLLGRVAAERRELSALSPAGDPSQEAAFMREHEVYGQHALPLLANGELIGVLQMGASSPRRLSDEEAALLRSVAERIASAIRQQQLREKAERLARERERLLSQRQLALDAAQMGWWCFEPSTNHVTFDRRCAEIYGVPGELPADELAKRIHPEDQARVLALIEPALDPRNPRTYSAEYRVIRPDGEERWIAASGLAVFEGEGLARRATALVGTMADITERKRAEYARQDAGRRKNEFLATLSHELRNPLAPIRNSLFVVEHSPANGEQARRARATIDRQMTQLTRLVDDLLDVTRIDRGKIRLQRARVELAGLVRRVAEDHRALLQEHELELSLPAEPLWLDADEARLAQVAGNLLWNAAKFTPTPGKILVSLAVLGDEAVLEVTDTGVGLDRETIERLFEPFTQADRSLDRSRGGLGLGRALVKGITELHGGRVSAHSDGPGRGARFTVRLPRAERDGGSEP